MTTDIAVTLVLYFQEDWSPSNREIPDLHLRLRALDSQAGTEITEGDNLVIEDELPINEQMNTFNLGAMAYNAWGLSVSAGVAVSGLRGQLR